MDEWQGPPRKTRPPCVTLLAPFQFLRAAIVLCVLLSVWEFPDSHLDSRLEVKALTYLATQHPLPEGLMIPVVLPLSAVYLSSIGVGLWRLKKWARNVLMITSGATAASLA